MMEDNATSSPMVSKPPAKRAKNKKKRKQPKLQQLKIAFPPNIKRRYDFYRIQIRRLLVALKNDLDERAIEDLNEKLSEIDKVCQLTHKLDPLKNIYSELRRLYVANHVQTDISSSILLQPISFACDKLFANDIVSKSINDDDALKKAVDFYASEYIDNPGISIGLNVLGKILNGAKEYYFSIDNNTKTDDVVVK